RAQEIRLAESGKIAPAFSAYRSSMAIKEWRGDPRHSGMTYVRSSAMIRLEQAVADVHRADAIHDQRVADVGERAEHHQVTDVVARQVHPGIYRMEEGLAAALRIVGLVLHRILGLEDREHLPV